ncbi:MAG: methionine--tRNA ligase [Candidatus Pacebacteria bacterium]|nr:methionine--tRNA ligase [Candidatus Paceibacterota bacterium]
MKRFISTAIPYVNAHPHLGHALEYVQADFYARAQRLKSRADGDVFFLTGTDDNALKNVQAAELAGIPIIDFISQNAQYFIDLDQRLGISYDYFIRTSVDEQHRDGAQKLWLSSKPEDIYKKTYKGWYCIGCEEFKPEKDIVNGECVLHPGKKLEEIEEENYFFRLSSYQDQLEELIASDTLRITPEGRKNEILAFIRGGLEDFSISRSATRAKGWGIQVPNDPDQIIYVWYDALANYITALGYANDSEKFKEYWTDAESRTHFIGKDINRFHTIYWPAMLLSAGVALPTTVFVHGFITSDGQKMSKSIGNVIDPNEVINRFGPEFMRYFLLRHGSPTEDFDVTTERLEDAYTANLVNGIGNLVARIMKLAEDHLAEPVILDDGDLAVEEAFFGHVDQFRFNDALDFVFEMVAECDAVMTERMPYKKVKSEDEGIRNEGKHDITLLVKHLAKIAAHLSPAMPDTSAAIIDAIKENKKPINLFPRLSDIA